MQIDSDNLEVYHFEQQLDRLTEKVSKGGLLDHVQEGEMAFVLGEEAG
jgi:hypothetical protein